MLRMHDDDDRILERTKRAIWGKGHNWRVQDVSVFLYIIISWSEEVEIHLSRPRKINSTHMHRILHNARGFMTFLRFWMDSIVRRKKKIKNSYAYRLVFITHRNSQAARKKLNHNVWMWIAECRQSRVLRARTELFNRFVFWMNWLYFRTKNRFFINGILCDSSNLPKPDYFWISLPDRVFFPEILISHS